MVGSSSPSSQSWCVELHQISKTASRLDYDFSLWSLKTSVISSLASWSPDLFSHKQKRFLLSEHFIAGGIVECPRKGEMGPIIKEKFVSSFYVYMKMPKPPVVTIAGLGKAFLSSAQRYTHSRGRSSQLNPGEDGKKAPRKVSPCIPEFYRKYRKSALRYTFYFNRKFPNCKDASDNLNPSGSLKYLSSAYH